MGLILNDKNLNIGSISGICSLCSTPTNQGLPLSFPNNFQGYSYLDKLGRCLCPPCNYFLSNQNFTKKSWIASKEGIRFLERTECQDIILSPPLPPFFIYISRLGQYQGWLNALEVVNYKREEFIISTDWAGKFYLKRNTAIELCALYIQLRKLKISKSALRTGYLRPAEYYQITKNSAEHLIQELHAWKSTPIWETIVYISN